MRTDVIAVHNLVEMTLFKHLMHLRIYTRENNMNALIVASLNQATKVVNTGRIHERNLTHTDDSYQRTML